MTAPSKRWSVLARGGEIEYDRVLFFSDAVFAIAVTLLIVDLRVPDVPNLQSGRELRNAIPQIGGFAYSFAAVGLFWLAHHASFATSRAWIARWSCSICCFLAQSPSCHIRPLC